MNVKTKRILGLDYMRGMACLLVVLYHYTTRVVESFPYIGDKWHFRVSFGYMGVCIFFMLSGYLSIKLYREDISIWKYIKNKVLRLYPCYWCAAILTFIITSLFLVERTVSWKSLLINLTMLESFLGVDPVDGAYWTLANELIFYAFFAIVFVILKKKSMFSYVAIAWVFITNIIICFESKSIVYLIANKFFMAQYAHMFLAGGFIFILYSSKRKSDRMINLLGWIFCIATQFRLFSIGYGFFFLISNIILMYIATIEKQKNEYPRCIVKVLKPLSFVASISYPFYLIHQNIGYALIVNIYKTGFQSEIIIFIPIIVLMLLSYLMHKMIEMPINKK